MVMTELPEIDSLFMPWSNIDQPYANLYVGPWGGIVANRDVKYEERHNS